MCNEEEARKASLTLNAICVWLRKLLDPDHANTPDDKVKEEERSHLPESDYFPGNSAVFDLAASNSAVVADSAGPDSADSNPATTHSTTLITASKPVTLPDVISKEVFRGYKCNVSIANPT